MHEKTIEIRSRDIDKLGHVNNAVYLTYLEEVRDEWLAGVLGPKASLENFVIARVGINYRSQVVQADDVVIARCGLDRIGTSSVTTREDIVLPDGRLISEAECVLVFWDRVGNSRPMEPADRAAFEQAAARGGS